MLQGTLKVCKNPGSIFRRPMRCWSPVEPAYELAKHRATMMRDFSPQDPMSHRGLNRSSLLSEEDEEENGEGAALADVFGVSLSLSEKGEDSRICSPLSPGSRRRRFFFRNPSENNTNTTKSPPSAQPVLAKPQCPLRVLHNRCLCFRQASVFSVGPGLLLQRPSLCRCSSNRRFRRPRISWRACWPTIPAY